VYISSTPEIVVVVSCQPINQDRHRADLGHQIILRPWNPSFHSTCGTRGDFLCRLKQRLLQNNGPSHSPSSNVSINFLLQLGCTMWLHSWSSHFSKLSSAFRHFECSLHVVSIWPFTEWSLSKMERRIKNDYTFHEGVFWVSDFVFQKTFIWTKTQKRDLKINWQPLIWS